MRQRRINEDIFRDINPDDLMNDDSDYFDDDYSDGLSRNPDRNDNYKYGFWIEIIPYSKTVSQSYIDELIAYLIDAFESHSGNVGTYSDISVMYNLNPNDKWGNASTHFSDGCKQTINKFPNPLLSAHLMFMFNLQNPRRFVLRLITMIRDYAKHDDSLKFQTYLWTDECVYSIRDILPEIDAVLGYDEYDTYLITRFGREDQPEKRINKLTLSGRKCVSLMYRAEPVYSKLIYMNEKHMYIEKTFPGYIDTTYEYMPAALTMYKNYKLPKSADKYACVYCNKKRSLMNAEMNILPLSASIIVFIKDSKCTKKKPSGYFFFIDTGKEGLKSGKLVGVVDYISGRILDEDEYEQDENNYSFVRITDKSKDNKIEEYFWC